MVLELLRNDPLMDIEMRNPVSIHGRRHFYRDEPGPVLTAMMLSPPGQGRRGRPRLAFMVARDGASVLQTSSPSPRLNGGCVAGNEGSGHIESNHGGMRAWLTAARDDENGPWAPHLVICSVDMQTRSVSARA